jgi:hypothetical protein
MTIVNASQMAKLLGRRGGRARARRLSAAERRRIASLGGKARVRSLEAARHVIDNLRYAALVVELQGGATPVRPMKNFKGPLPGIYPPGR